jgi:hypothetical protein
MSEQIPADWYPDPDDGGISERWWDGNDWTEQARPAARPSPRPRPSPMPAPTQPVYAPPAAVGYAPPPTQPNYGQPQQPRRRWISRHKRLAAAIAIVAVIIIAVASNSSSNKSGSTAGLGTSTQSSGPTSTHSGNRFAGDVSITSCKPDATTGYLAANVTVTNHSSKTSNYIITVAFDTMTGNQQLDTTPVAVDNLDPGQVSHQLAVGLSAAPAGGYTCKIADITRYAS